MTKIRLRCATSHATNAMAKVAQAAPKQEFIIVNDGKPVENVGAESAGAHIAKMAVPAAIALVAFAVAAVATSIQAFGFRQPIVVDAAGVIVCGHSDCGAMKALLNPEGLTGLPNVSQWLRHAEGARHALDPVGAARQGHPDRRQHDAHRRRRRGR